MADEKEVERASRLLARAKMKRTSVIYQIRAIHAMASRVQSEPELAHEFALNAADLDSLWFQHRYIIQLDSRLQTNIEAQ